jgi:hypothetical protein
MCDFYIERKQHFFWKENYWSKAFPDDFEDANKGITEKKRQSVTLDNSSCPLKLHI